MKVIKGLDQRIIDEINGMYDSIISYNKHQGNADDIIRNTVHQKAFNDAIVEEKDED